MTRIFQTRSRALIAATPGVVFDAVVDPVNWPALHPISRSVELLGEVLTVGSKFTETVDLGGTAVVLVWDVLSLRPPVRWMISTRAELSARSGRVEATMTVLFTITEHESGMCRLERSMLTAVNSDAPLSPSMLEVFDSSVHHDRYTGAIKHRVETLVDGEDTAEGGRTVVHSAPIVSHRIRGILVDRLSPNSIGEGPCWPTRSGMIYEP